MTTRTDLTGMSSDERQMSREGRRYNIMVPSTSKRAEENYTEVERVRTASRGSARMKTEEKEEDSVPKYRNPRLIPLLYLSFQPSLSTAISFLCDLNELITGSQQLRMDRCRYSTQRKKHP